MKNKDDIKLRSATHEQESQENIEKGDEILEEKINKDTPKVTSEPMLLGKIVGNIKSSGRKAIAIGLLLGIGYAAGSFGEYNTEVVRGLENKIVSYRRSVSDESYKDWQSLRLEPTINEKNEVECYLVNKKTGDRYIVDDRGLVPGDVEDRVYGNFKRWIEKGKGIYNELESKGKQKVLEFTSKGKNYIIEIYENGKQNIDNMMDTSPGEPTLKEKAVNIFNQTIDYAAEKYHQTKNWISKTLDFGNDVHESSEEVKE